MRADYEGLCAEYEVKNGSIYEKDNLRSWDQSGMSTGDRQTKTGEALRGRPGKNTRVV